MLLDSLNRSVAKLRVSVTDRCDLRCVYCMPEEGLAWLPKSEVMTFEEIARLCRVVAHLGVKKIRLTGGEPLVRRDLPVLVRMIREQSDVESIGMTSNGLQLARYAAPLQQAGLTSVNISLDSLDRERFHQLTRRDGLVRVLEGLEAAAEVFPGKVKINCVTMPGLSDEVLAKFVGLAKTLNLVIRFIEFMPLDADQQWQAEAVISGADLRERIHKIAGLESFPYTDAASPAREYRFVEGKGGIGFINSVSEPFCQSCDRIRVTADGRLRTCLFSTQETNLLAVLRYGSEQALREVLREAVWQKQAGHRINDEAFERASRSMSQIGG